MCHCQGKKVALWRAEEMEGDLYNREGPAATVYMVYLKKNKEASVAGAQNVSGI